jgi:chitinase
VNPLCNVHLTQSETSPLGGSSDTRPFGDAVLDGVDLDIEGGSTTGYAAFVKQLRTHMDNAGKK